MATKALGWEGSKGARLERAAVRAMLRRRLKHCTVPQAAQDLQGVLAWVLSRQQRYERRRGGL
jgi:hypothetical protein